MPREVVVVTGGSAGVGRSVAMAFAREGADVAILARGRERLEAAQADLEAVGGRAMAIPADVADPDQVERAADAVERELGPIDIWINNAMATILAPFERITPGEFVRATEVTYLGAVWGTRAALKRMRPRNRGVIVQVGSALAHRSIPLQAPYCGAKHALKGFTDSIRTELLHERSAIRLTMVQLPGLNTPQFSWCLARVPHHPRPVPPVFQPEVAAEAIVWAARHPRREMYVGFPTLKAIFGEKFAARAADWVLARRGYSGQQTRDPIPQERVHNLFVPVQGPFGSHGRFDGEARAFSLQLWINRHRAAAWTAAGILGLALLLLA